MKKYILILFMFLGFFSKGNATYEQLAYSFKFNGINEEVIELKEYKNKVIIVVNVASRCGFTNQYEGMQELWKKYKDQGLVVIGVPANNFNQEPGSNQEIKTFCETTFGVNFPMTKKVSVKGSNAHPFYEWAKLNYGSKAIPKWNFHKIIINKNGKISNAFSSITKPSSSKFINFIEEEIKS